jgi:uncharacterized membrane protein
MSDTFLFALTLVSALGCGLMAGVFFAFSAFIMRALTRIEPSQGIAAMQSINVSVLNPLFMASFFGTAAACIVLAIYSLINWEWPGTTFLLIGSVLYVVGTLLVTIVFNVPRNDALAALDPTNVNSSKSWASYVAGWTAWNHVRTVAALAAAASLTMAIPTVR